MIKLLTHSLILTALITPASSQVEFLKGDGKSCDAVCKTGGGKPVIGGYYKSGKNAFLLCTADAKGEGWRIGYNLRPNLANVCVIALDGKEVQEKTYSCGCY